MKMHAFSFERERRCVHQMMPGGPYYEHGFSGQEYGPEGFSYDAYDALPYERQLGYMQQPFWMNAMIDAQSHAYIDQMQSHLWYADALQGGLPFDAFNEGHYMPYGYFYHGTDWWNGHPAWNMSMQEAPQFSYEEPPYPMPTPAPVRRQSSGSRPHSRRLAPAPQSHTTPAPLTQPARIDRTPSHPLDRDGRLAAAYAPYFNSPDPTVQLAAQRWWNKAIDILYRHPNDAVIFAQLVRGASDNLGRATRQHNGVAETRREWEARMPIPQRSMRIANNPGDPASAIIVTRNGDFNDRILYYPNKSSPFWDMRSMERAREWGIVFESDTYATGQYPSSVSVKFYGPGNFSVSGVAGIRVPESQVVVGESAQRHAVHRAQEQVNSQPLHLLPLYFGSRGARAVEVRDQSGKRIRMLPTPGSTTFEEGCSLEDLGNSHYLLRMHVPGRYQVTRIYTDGGTIVEDVTVAPPRTR